MYYAIIRAMETEPIHSFIVCRDGDLDDEYYDRMWHERKKEIWLRSRRKAYKTPFLIGKGILSLLSLVLEQME